MAQLSRKFVSSQKEKLLKEKAKSLLQIEEFKKDDPFSDPDHAIDNAAVDTDVREQVGHETIEAEIKDLRRKLTDVNIALEKMRKGKYGYCERCGLLIPLTRLKILPEARYDVE